MRVVLGCGTMDDLIDGVMTFEEETDGVNIAVQSFYLEDQSEPEDGQFVWAYRIRIENRSDDTVQLINRHWVITDARGKVDEVKGTGVVGEQPTLGPGEHFVYTSGTPLATPSGFMRGTYEMLRSDGSAFLADVPAFSLDSPFSETPLH